MKTNRSFSLVRLLPLALLAASLSPGWARAQAVAQGKFTLPFDAIWGSKVLPAGDYAFDLRSASLPALVTLRDGTRGHAIAFIMAQATSQNKSSERSSLTVIRHGGKGIVRSMYLADLGQVFYYPTPRSVRKLLAQGPQLIQRVPVSAMAK